MHGIAYFGMFLFLTVALYGFTQGGMWAWAFVPVFGGLACSEVGGYLWKKHLRKGAGKDLDRSEEAT